jgi:plastocyanin
MTRLDWRFNKWRKTLRLWDFNHLLINKTYNQIMKTINTVILVLVIGAVVLGVVYFAMRFNVSTPYGTAPANPNPSTSLPPTNIAQTQPNTPQTTPQISVPPSANAAQPAAAAVTIQNFTFSPSPLTVSVGTTVAWTNMDSVDHQIKSTTFNSSPLPKGQTYSFTFTTAGTYDYSCAIHPTMRGQIIVQ